MKLGPTMFLLVSLCPCLWAQAPVDRRDVRGGNRDFRKGNFKEAEIDYRKALVKDSTSVAANYNLANTLYRMEEYQDAAGFAEAAEWAEKSDIYFNKGDMALQNKDYNTAVEAFKRSLLLNPDDVEAKENYIYARKMLENQQQNGGGSNQNNQNQNQDQNQDQDQNRDQNQNKDQDQNKDQNNQNQDQDRDGNDDNRQPQEGQQPELSPQAAEQMLQAIEEKEKDTQDKVKKEEALRARSRRKEKNW